MLASKTAGYPAIVTDGLWRKSLSAIRSLGKSGYQVHVIGNSRFTTGFWSRFTHARVLAPSAAEDREGFGRALLEYLRKFPSERPPVLLPMEDASLIWVSENREKLAGLALFSIPSRESIKICEDKSLTLEFARSSGIPSPETLSPASPAELAEMILSWNRDGGRRSWVVKPVRGSGSIGIVYGPDSDPVDWKDHWRTHGPSILQERVPASGRALGSSFLMNEGRCVARFSHERLRQYPISGGPSTDRVSAHLPTIEEQSLVLLRKLNWSGVAMVEWKEDATAGIAKLMEINPRFWGSLELAVRSGVDFPSLYAGLCRRLELPSEPPEYPDGVRCRWMIPGEILRYLRTPPEQRESLRSFLKGLPSLAEEWDSADLRGTLASLICTLVLALQPKYWKYLRRG